MVTENRPNSEWVDLAAAAARFGLSTDAVRQRIRRGTVTARKVGKAWRVSVPVQVAEPGPPHEANELVIRLLDEVTWLRSQLEEAARERSELRQLLAMAQQATAARSLPEPTEHRPDGDRTVTEHQPWWRRLFA